MSRASRFGMAAAATVAGAALVSLFSGCPDPEVQLVEVTAVEEGRKRYSDADLSDAPGNRLACVDCHADNDDDARFLPGGSLVGVTKRTSFWGGQENTLLRSINNCLYFFMSASEPWTGEEDEAINLYAYLESLEGSEEPVSVTIGELVDPGEGSSQAGKEAYDRACGNCHGSKTSAAGRLVPSAPTLPEETLANHPDPDYDDAERRLVFVEKTRHGGFLGYGGQMPFFSLETLSDEDLADILSYLGVP